jgi:hypothetical protein
MPLFGKRRAEFSPEIDSYLLELVRNDLVEGSSLITLSITNSLVRELAELVMDSVDKTVPSDFETKVYNQYVAKLYPELRTLVDKAKESVDSRLESDLDQILGAVCVELSLRALLHFSALVAARLSGSIAYEWMIETRTGLFEEEVDEIKSQLIKKWEDELQRRRAERAAKRRQEEEQEWEKIRSMDPSQRALEIFEIAETLKSMKDKPWMTRMSEEQEAAKKRRDEQEALALKQDEEDDKRAREQADKDAREKLKEEKLEKWMSKLLSLISVAGDTWVKEVAGEENQSSDFETSLLNMSKELVMASQSDGDAENAFQVIQGHEIGKATRELIPEISNWIRGFTWS